MPTTEQTADLCSYESDESRGLAKYELNQQKATPLLHIPGVILGRISPITGGSEVVVPSHCAHRSHHARNLAVFTAPRNALGGESKNKNDSHYGEQLGGIDLIQAPFEAIPTRFFFNDIFLLLSLLFRRQICTLA